MKKSIKKGERSADRIRQLAQFYIGHKAFRGMNMFEKACGLSPKYVNNLCSTACGNAGVDTIAAIYRTFRGINLHWLVLGEGDMFTIGEDEAVRAAKDATADMKMEQKVRSVLNSKTLKGMTREEKMELVERIINGN